MSGSSDCMAETSGEERDRGSQSRGHSYGLSVVSDLVPVGGYSVLRGGREACTLNFHGECESPN